MVPTEFRKEHGKCEWQMWLYPPTVYGMEQQVELAFMSLKTGLFYRWNSFLRISTRTAANQLSISHRWRRILRGNCHIVQANVAYSTRPMSSRLPPSSSQWKPAWRDRLLLELQHTFIHQKWFGGYLSTSSMISLRVFTCLISKGSARKKNTKLREQRLWSFTACFLMQF